MPTTVMRKFTFDAGHRVIGHEGKCKYLHGHTYTAEVSFEANRLDSLGRVIDFGVLKQIVGSWIDDNLDHNFIAHSEDPILNLGQFILGRSLYVMPYGKNPTAENIAEEIFSHVAPLLPNGIKITHIRLWETPNCCADFEPNQISIKEK